MADQGSSRRGIKKYAIAGAIGVIALVGILIALAYMNPPRKPFKIQPLVYQQTPPLKVPQLELEKITRVQVMVAEHQILIQNPFLIQ